MGLIDLWKRLCQKFRFAPVQWKVAEGDETDGPYRHSTSILGLSFSPDDTILAMAGGGCIPGVDGSIRLIDVDTRKNVQTLHAHVCGVHDVSFDPQSGVLASASFDYAVHLWDRKKKDVIFLRGEDYKTKGYCRFTREGSLLAIGEYAYYEGPHSFYIYDIQAQNNVFEFALPNGMGVTSMALSSDSKYMAVSACDLNQTIPSRLYVVDLGLFEIVQEHAFEETGFYNIAFVEGQYRLVAGIGGGILPETGASLIEIDLRSGEIVRKETLGGIGVTIASRPHSREIAVGFDNSQIRIYDSITWSLLREHRFKNEGDPGRISKLTYSNSGDLLAFGLSNGIFGIIESNETTTSTPTND